MKNTRFAQQWTRPTSQAVWLFLILYLFGLVLEVTGPTQGSGLAVGYTACLAVGFHGCLFAHRPCSLRWHIGVAIGLFLLHGLIEYLLKFSH